MADRTVDVWKAVAGCPDNGIDIVRRAGRLERLERLFSRSGIGLQPCPTCIAPVSSACWWRIDPMLTVLVATRNGAGTLPHVLEGYQRLAAVPGGWKLVIVNNASTDATRDVIRRFDSSLPLTYCEESRPGKNRALLTGLREAEGDLFVFSDDDATPDPPWLVSLRRAADEHHAFDVFAGAIRPRWEVEPAPWVLRGSGSRGLLRDFGHDPAGRSDQTHTGLGTPTWRSVAECSSAAIGSTRTSVRAAGATSMGSETDLVVRLAEAGFLAWFCPDAVVDHFIRAHQVERPWILGRAIAFGRGTYRRRLLRQVERPRLWFGVPRYLCRQIATRAVRVLMGGEFRRPGSFHERWALGRLLGCAIQARHHYKRVTT